MKKIILTAPTVEPITLDEAKAQLRIEIDVTFDDDYINSLISVARDRCQNYCNQFFTVQDIALVGIAVSQILPYPNLTITAVEVDDVVTTEFTYDNDTQLFILNTTGDKLKIFATTGAPVEFLGVEQGIKMIVTDMYEVRAESLVGVSIAENPALKALLYPYRLSLGV